MEFSSCEATLVTPKCVLCQALVWQPCSDPPAMEQRARLLGDTGQLWTFRLNCPALRSPACGITQGHVLMGITENKDVAGLSAVHLCVT